MNEKAVKLLGKDKYTFDDLCDIMEILRGEGGCPWDREQTHKSIRRDMIEETYEAVEAIDTDDMTLLREELGDVMLQVVFHAEIERERGTFDVIDVISDECIKLISRHPHVFSDVTAETSEQVLTNWEKIKSEEKERKNATMKLRAIPVSFPALLRADKLGRVSKKAGFDFESADDAFKKIPEETEEVACEIKSGDHEKLFEEIGDLLLSVVNAARLLGINSEDALNAACDKYVDRFERMEREVEKSGHITNDLPMRELDAIWDRVKHINAEKLEKYC